jgi:hypothetical protein
MSPKQPVLPQGKFAEHTKETKVKEQPPTIKWTPGLIALGNAGSALRTELESLPVEPKED